MSEVEQQRSLILFTNTKYTENDEIHSFEV